MDMRIFDKMLNELSEAEDHPSSEPDAAWIDDLRKIVQREVSAAVEDGEDREYIEDWKDELHYELESGSRFAGFRKKHEFGEDWMTKNNGIGDQYFERFFDRAVQRNFES